jgi:hypothetical protein
MRVGVRFYDRKFEMLGIRVDFEIAIVSGRGITLWLLLSD